MTSDRSQGQVRRRDRRRRPQRPRRRDLPRPGRPLGPRPGAARRRPAVPRSARARSPGSRHGCRATPTSSACMPDQIVSDLGLDLELKSRSVASYTPVHREGRHSGLFVERNEGKATAESFRRLTGSDGEYDAWRKFYGEVREFTEAVAPTLLEPLRTAREVRDLVDPATWDYLVEQPLGQVIEQRFADDTVRGVVATDALIGTFADMNDGVAGPEPLLPLPPRRQRHRRVARPGRRHGCGHRRAGGRGPQRRRHDRHRRRRQRHRVRRRPRPRSPGTTATPGGPRPATGCSSNVAPWVLQVLLGEEPGERPEGSQLKVNLLLERLPRLKSGEAAQERVRRHLPRRRGLQPAPEGLRRGRGRRPAHAGSPASSTATP